MASEASSDTRYSLGDYGTAETAYNHLERDRQPVLDTAREMAEVTIPSVMPPQGYRTGDRLPSNNQSVGAYCVNTLASNLMFLAMPPGRPMMRFEVVEHRLRDEIANEPDMWSRVEVGLSRLEQAHRRRAQTTSLRSAYVGCAKLLLVAGNALWKHINVDTPTYFRPDAYVVERDSAGVPLLTILKESRKLAALDADTRAFIMVLKPELKRVPEWERVVDIYSICRRHTDEDGEVTWCYWQEAFDKMLPGTEVETDADNPPLYPAWLIPVYGQNWGRSYCEEYRGDLYTVETHSSALNDGAAAASLVMTFVRPGSQTTVKQVREADNLSVHAGSADDITTYRLEKGSDFAVVESNLERAERRLGRAFALYTSIQRDAERVTAEEWRTLAVEVDKAMGGIYSELALSFQRHVVNRFVALHEDEDGELPVLPRELIRVGVVTGIDALGRSTENIALVELGAELNATFGPETAREALSVTDFARRVAAMKGIQPKGLIREEEDLAADQEAAEQAAMKRTLLEKGAGPAITQMGQGLAAAAQQQPTQQEQ